MPTGAGRPISLWPSIPIIYSLLKLANVVSPRLQEGSQMVYKFFRTAVTYPILFAVGVAITPWQELVNAFTLTNRRIYTPSATPPADAETPR